MAKKKYYVVVKGISPGIYKSWDECDRQVRGYSGAIYKGFGTLADAELYLNVETKKLAADMEKKSSSVVTAADISDGEDINQLNSEQKKALDIMSSGTNVFLTGKAGTGKTYLLKCFLQTQKDKNILICAPTGIASVQIGGVTLHSAFGLPVEPLLPDFKISGKAESLLKETDLVVIDEISMCRFDLFEIISSAILKNESEYHHKIQVVVCGDFYQLPPVIKSEDRDILYNGWGPFNSGFAFSSEGWNRMQFQKIVLTTNMRQAEGEFLSSLNRIRDGDYEAIEWFNKNTADTEQAGGIFLAAINDSVNKKNQENLAKLKTEHRIYYGTRNNYNTSYLPTLEKLELAEGARVMSLVNKGNKYQNGSLGTVETLEDGYVVVKFDNGNIEKIMPYKWIEYEYLLELDVSSGKKNLVKTEKGYFEQIPLKIAYAVTIHKSQGQTYDSINLDPECFGEGQLYVALSRAKDEKKIYLTKPIKNEWLNTSQEVCEFMKK